MPFPTRKFIFITGDKILAEEWASELEYLYAILSGTEATQFFVKQRTDNPVLLLQNVKAGKSVVDFLKASEIKLQILGTQQLKSLVTNVAPIEVASTTVVPNLNAELLDDLPFNFFVLNNTKHTEYWIPFEFPSASSIAPVVKIFIVPAGTNMQLTTSSTQGEPLEGDDLGGVDIEIRKNGVAIELFTLSLANSYSSTNVLNENVVENDIISMHIVAIDNLGLARFFSRIIMKQDLVA